MPVTRSCASTRAHAHHPPAFREDVGKGGSCMGGTDRTTASREGLHRGGREGCHRGDVGGAQARACVCWVYVCVYVCLSCYPRSPPMVIARWHGQVYMLTTMICWHSPVCMHGVGAWGGRSACVTVAPTLHSEGDGRVSRWRHRGRVACCYVQCHQLLTQVEFVTLVLLLAHGGGGGAQHSQSRTKPGSSSRHAQ